jgi:uncharacterized protein (TIGR02597 family)
LPFTQPPVFTGTLASAPGTGPQLAISGSPGWNPGQWAILSTPNNYAPYFAFLVTGAQAGAWFTITNNDASNLYVTLTPENASLAAAGDQVTIVPFWTLNTVWPNGTGVVATTLSSSPKSEVLFPSIGSVGINLSPEATYYFYNNNWRKVGPPSSSNFNDVAILPDQYVTLRSNGTTPSTNFLALGAVVTNNIRIPVYANSVANGNKQDNYIGIYRPTTLTLDQSGLASMVVTTTLSSSPKDEVLVYTNAVSGENKSPVGTYFFYNDAWRKVGPPASVNFGPSNVFFSAQGFVYRAVPNNTPIRMWDNQPNY